ncbi:MAG: hypothetical protein APG08_01039 [Candidatus Methanofastidiosum methylothiophilum]|jgi:hypothetical protein|uniref:Uncharacterized protein n=1 Tax=Candidatus Methanofastidiosum methylothiophilum TaxID=1705564 RepID=A0A150JB85_9EURY|nr:MAG: hypothetical protein AN188_01060 [Candidatus Methanofastidiosum methylthiophilus]MBP6932261.1 hypothetical protein [Methanofastidiosum sp.]OQC51139.1 MAG: hypothetical protein BWX56_01117 [Euryarchaeota archaeon ADurb.Bin023]KYC56289.1 MAG: hypothetical protein APG08_01039 [Candidatus Methanofastidiosum methylthiophilus]KYC58131.1 MAG: hypothetical protein APG09_00634 [Candidatus Methanofastidiosum methylthiophilus]
MALTNGLKNDLEKEIQRRVVLTQEEIDHEKEKKEIMTQRFTHNEVEKLQYKKKKVIKSFSLDEELVNALDTLIKDKLGIPRSIKISLNTGERSSTVEEAIKEYIDKRNPTLLNNI